jgi:hypothetical protein
MVLAFFVFSSLRSDLTMPMGSHNHDCVNCDCEVTVTDTSHNQSDLTIKAISQ